jgi:type IV pilus assembly protein PilF
MLVAALLLASACVTTGGRPEPDKESIKNAADYNLQLGITYKRQGKFAVALEKLLRSVDQDPRRADTHAVLADLYDNLGETEKAGSEYRRSLRLESDNSLTLNNYGGFLCRQGDFKGAMKSFEKAVKNPLYKTPQAAYANAGTCARRNGDKGQALSYFRLALQADPKFSDALLQMADMNFADEIHLQARAFMDRYMQSTDRTTPDALWLGIRVEQALGDKAAAGAYSTQLLRKFPDSAEARWYLEIGKNAG